VHNHSALVLCFLSLLLGAHAFPETQEAKSARHIEQTIAALAQMTDADSLAAAGLLSLTKHREQSLPLIERALPSGLRPMPLPVAMRAGDPKGKRMASCVLAIRSGITR